MPRITAPSQRIRPLTLSHPIQLGHSQSHFSKTLLITMSSFLPDSPPLGTAAVTELLKSFTRMRNARFVLPLLPASPPAPFGPGGSPFLCLLPGSRLPELSAAPKHPLHRLLRPRFSSLPFTNPFTPVSCPQQTPLTAPRDLLRFPFNVSTARSTRFCYNANKNVTATRYLRWCPASRGWGLPERAGAAGLIRNPRSASGLCQVSSQSGRLNE